MWEPLPLIIYGYAIHPLSPSRRDTYSAARNRLSTFTEASADENTFGNVVSLEVGDEVYAFEKYTPSSREPVEGIWYRGYVRHQRPTGMDSFNILQVTLSALHAAILSYGQHRPKVPIHVLRQSQKSPSKSSSGSSPARISISGTSCRTLKADSQRYIGP